MIAAFACAFAMATDVLFTMLSTSSLFFAFHTMRKESP